MESSISEPEFKKPVPIYKPLIKNTSRMMSNQSGRFHRLREEKNQEIIKYNANLKEEYEKSL